MEGNLAVDRRPDLLPA